MQYETQLVNLVTNIKDMHDNLDAMVTLEEKVADFTRSAKLRWDAAVDYVISLKSIP